MQFELPSPFLASYPSPSYSRCFKLLHATWSVFALISFINFWLFVCCHSRHPSPGSEQNSLAHTAQVETLQVCPHVIRFPLFTFTILKQQCVEIFARVLLVVQQTRINFKLTSIDYRSLYDQQPSYFAHLLNIDYKADCIWRSATTQTSCWTSSPTRTVTAAQRFFCAAPHLPKIWFQ